MADIFILYSRKDSDETLLLAERLRAAGADVWMDTSALTASETWSTEIVNGIKNCKSFIVLLSPDAVSSPNVTKEVSLASEKRKAIMPIVVRKCDLSDTMEYALANLYTNLGEKEKAVETARKMISIAPKRSSGYAVTAFMYKELGNLQEAARYFEQALAISPASLRDHQNVIATYLNLGEREHMKKAVIRSIPYYEQYLTLRPDDQSTRVQLMLALERIDRHDLANHEAGLLLPKPDLFGHTYYQISSVYGRQGLTEKAIELLRIAAEKGYINFDELRDDKEWFATVQALPNFNALIAELEAIVTKKNG
jgi:tetratricopeptide (TPR) repeat protein